jgi:hypothetical protein
MILYLSISICLCSSFISSASCCKVFSASLGPFGLGVFFLLGVFSLGGGGVAIGGVFSRGGGLIEDIELDYELLSSTSEELSSMDEDDTSGVIGLKAGLTN